MFVFLFLFIQFLFLFARRKMPNSIRHHFFWFSFFLFCQYFTNSISTIRSTINLDCAHRTLIYFLLYFPLTSSNAKREEMSEKKNSLFPPNRKIDQIIYRLLIVANHPNRVRLQIACHISLIAIISSSLLSLHRLCAHIFH